MANSHTKESFAKAIADALALDQSKPCFRLKREWEQMKEYLYGNSTGTRSHADPALHMVWASWKSRGIIHPEWRLEQYGPLVITHKWGHEEYDQKDPKWRGYDPRRSRPGAQFQDEVHRTMWMTIPESEAEARESFDASVKKVRKQWKENGFWDRTWGDWPPTNSCWPHETGRAQDSAQSAQSAVDEPPNLGRQGRSSAQDSPQSTSDESISDESSLDTPCPSANSHVKSPPQQPARRTRRDRKAKDPLEPGKILHLNGPDHLVGGIRKKRGESEHNPDHLEVYTGQGCNVL